MTDKPIPFSAPMVRALLEGRKTQTRRVLEPKGAAKAAGCEHLRLDVLDGMLWWWDGEHDSVGASQSYPYAPGDRLWVREAWRARLYNQDVPPRDMDPCATRLHYEADGAVPECDDGTNWDRYRHARFMPRWASRLTLTVTDVRVQRLQDISEADALAEGSDVVQARMYPELGTCRHWFEDLWNSLHGPNAWDANPWVCALTFDVRRCNIDQLTD